MTRTRSTQSAYRTHDAKRLAAYLRAEAERANGALHVNGDRLADGLERPPAEIERQLRELSGEVPGLRISRYSTSQRSLWRVSRP
ncbi:MAG: hypothetical protein ACQET5_00835 [Halobacteriota archaeon]|uniref:hypothetical protein n=1 Tax=Natronomonas sp. TaxID=2184060 RepID=UPI0039762ECA